MGPSLLIIRSNYFQTIFLLVLSLLFWGCSKHSGISNNNFYEIKISGKNAHVEIASTGEERTLGLMHREKLDKDHGMLFIFPQEQYLSFWMKNTKIPLSIAFINSRGVVTQIESMLPNSLDTHSSTRKVRYALEMEKGWFKKNSIKVGSKAIFSTEINNIKVK